MLFYVRDKEFILGTLLWSIGHRMICDIGLQGDFLDLRIHFSDSKVHDLQTAEIQGVYFFFFFFCRYFTWQEPYVLVPCS